MRYPLLSLAERKVEKRPRREVSTVVSYLGDASRLKNQNPIELPLFQNPKSPSGEPPHGIMQSRVNVIAAHMFKQLKEHEAANSNTNRLFDQLLNDIQDICLCFQDAFSQRELRQDIRHQFFAQVDADRSVGILNILWHALSFTTRGNTKPLALYRSGRDPIFTGRILALQGDFHDIVMEFPEEDYSGSLLQNEIASLYVPADATAPAVMKVKHLGEEEFYYHQADASRMFLLKTIEIVCGGGFFHEKDY